MLKQKWKYVLSGLFLCVLLGFGAIWYFLARNPSTAIERELILVSLTNTVAGPVARLHAVDPWYLKITGVTVSDTVCKFYLFRHGKWSEDPDSSNVQWIPWLRKDTAAMKGGYTVDVGVPVCEKWKVECFRRERRKFRSKFVPLQFWLTTRWDSAELPGWSEIRKEFRTLEK